MRATSAVGSSRTIGWNNRCFCLRASTNTGIATYIWVCTKSSWSTVAGRCSSSMRPSGRQVAQEPWQELRTPRRRHQNDLRDVRPSKRLSRARFSRTKPSASSIEPIPVGCTPFCSWNAVSIARQRVHARQNKPGVGTHRCTVEGTLVQSVGVARSANATARRNGFRSPKIYRSTRRIVRCLSTSPQSPLYHSRRSDAEP